MAEYSVEKCLVLISLETLTSYWVNFIDLTVTLQLPYSDLTITLHYLHRHGWLLAQHIEHSAMYVFCIPNAKLVWIYRKIEEDRIVLWWALMKFKTKSSVLTALSDFLWWFINDFFVKIWYCNILTTSVAK